MKRLYIAVLSFLILISIAFPSRAENLCGQRMDILETLKTRYHEAPISMGLAVNGGVVEVFASHIGTWTIVVTQPTGVSCVVSAGESWEDLKGSGVNDPGV
jgi:predicted benzoate:H+ symporter BenE